MYRLCIRMHQREPFQTQPRCQLQRLGHGSMVGNCHLRLNRPDSLPVVATASSWHLGKEKVFSFQSRSETRDMMSMQRCRTASALTVRPCKNVKVLLASKWPCLAPANSKHLKAAERSQQWMPHEQALGPNPPFSKARQSPGGETLQFSQIRAISPN